MTTTMMTSDDDYWGTGSILGQSSAGMITSTSGSYAITGQSNQVLTSSTSGLTWSNTISSGVMKVDSPFHVTGNAEIDGDITFSGRSLSQALDGIEKRLGILHPNKQLESRWDELKALGDRYRELEKEILEKEQTWNILQK